METVIWRINPENPDPTIIQEAARILKNGGLVAFPTETVYGLGANGLDPAAVRKIFRAKRRPSDNPLILHIANQQEVFYLAGVVPLKAQVLMEAFWPGPLTLVLPRSAFIPDEITAGLETVAVRMPGHPVALALIREAGLPVAAPSANLSGYPSPTRADHVWEDLAGRIDAVIDGGPTGLGLESTVLDVSGEVPVILRPGGVTRELLEETIGPVRYDPALVDPRDIPRAPGMKYTHYAPRAQVFLIDGEPETVMSRVLELVEDYTRQGRKVGLLLTDEVWQKGKKIETAYSKNLGSRRELEKIAHNIYSELRRCDAAGVDVILTETYKEEGLGTALMNRLLKSSGYKVINS
ncbi:MAG: L-threonylcarbamoyladenylate synthase [Peptococcaceae bacterium]|nr:L-threonylcarbamoyladenylate synthase [Peptococcaceae bacterium]MDH7523731.1 L-threonylcarbamoyladenylate synthase [Peptococcaceae bacterium]